MEPDFVLNPFMITGAVSGGKMKRQRERERERGTCSFFSVVVIFLTTGWDGFGSRIGKVTRVSLLGVD